METKQPETKQAAPKRPKKQGKNPLASNKFKRGGMATLLTVVFIAVVVAVNLLVTALTDRFPAMDIDLTAQGLNTLSDQALDIAGSVEEDVTIYLIGTEEDYEQNLIYSSYAAYGVEYSQVASLARRLAAANSHIHVEFRDPDTNPDFISQYSEENLTTGKVMVESARRHRVLTISDMFSIETEQSSDYSSTSYKAYSMVDSALAAALEMVTMEQVPVIALITGHGEMLSSSNMSSFITMMEEENFEVQEVDLLTEELPEDTQVVLLGTPTTDYSADELEKLRAFLNNTTQEEPTTVVATTFPTQGQLPNYSAFLEEWGVKVEPGVVTETDTSRMALANSAGVMVDANEELLSDNSYNRLVAYYSSPLTLLFDANDEITTYEMWSTADTATVITEDTTEEDLESLPTSSQLVATLSSRVVQVGDTTLTRSMMVVGSSYVFTDDFMGTTAFGDREYIRDMLLYLTANDGSKVSVTTERVQTGTMDVTASRSTVDFLGILFTAGIPVVILVAGLVIFLKRRHL